MISALSAATAGMQRAVSQLDSVASRVAGGGTDLAGSSGVDPVTEAAGLVEARTSLAANVAVARSATEMQKHLLDIVV